MSDTIVGALLALSGIIVGAILSGLRESRQFQREKWWQLQETRRARNEAIYEALVAHQSAYHAHLMRAMQEITAGAPMPGEAPPIPWERLSMLIGLYAPHLEDVLSRLNETGGALGQVIFDVATPKQRLTPMGDRIARLHHAFSALASVADEGRHILQADSRQLAAEASARVGMPAPDPKNAP
jgi:hypothetical protein